MFHTFVSPTKILEEFLDSAQIFTRRLHVPHIKILCGIVILGKNRFKLNHTRPFESVLSLEFMMVYSDRAGTGPGMGTGT